MKTAAIAVSRLRLAVRPGSAVRLSHFISLMKPRVMALAVFTALVGLMIAPARLDPLPGFIAILAIAAGAGAAGVLNMWYEADIDALMARTAGRPIPRGMVSRREALAFGLILAGGAVAVLALAINLTAAALLAFTIFFYVAVYTMWLKRSTPQNIVIGGAAGALPPMIGWAAASGEIALAPFVLFLIVFLWTPPHFWALSLNRAEEYARAGVPMLPVVAGRAETTRQILIYSILLFPVSLLPWALGFAGAIYGAAAAVGGAIFIALALQLARSKAFYRRPAHRLFAFSILYLFVLFAALLAGTGGERWSLTTSGRAAPAAVAPLDAPLCITRGSASAKPEGI
ncbi:MAG: protoheme IX farnesyltransferase [Hyphomicrobiales bacterium]|nr:protoheme IX farnesyltransferase [Hyphomicrobiales bacterium]MBV9427869.1 protoheme IX farnesyltransferase [Bradyrhizobiaceae bacterium]